MENTQTTKEPETLTDLEKAFALAKQHPDQKIIMTSDKNGTNIKMVPRTTNADGNTQKAVYGAENQTCFSEFNL